MTSETAIVKLRLVGGSVVISIPRRVLESAGMHVGDRVTLNVSSNGDNGVVVTRTNGAHYDKNKP